MGIDENYLMSYSYRFASWRASLVHMETLACLGTSWWVFAGTARPRPDKQCLLRLSLPGFSAMLMFVSQAGNSGQE